VTHLKLDVEMVKLEYGMEFEYLFGVPDEIPDITRSSGMVWRIIFILVSSTCFARCGINVEEYTT
jgi:hypothetical protein